MTLSGTTFSSTDTNTTYSVGAGGLTQQNFTTTLKNKLDGIAISANRIVNNNQLTNGAGYTTNTGTTTASNSQTFTNKTWSGALKPTTYQETYVAVGAASTITCNLANGNSFSTTMNVNTTFAFSIPPSSGTAFSFTLIVTQHSTARTITWPSSVDWAGGSAPAAAGNSEVQAYGFLTRDGGSTYYGFLGGTDIG